LEEFKSAHIRHVEIQQQQVWRMLGKHMCGNDRVFGQHHVVTGITQVNTQQLADRWIVVDDENRAVRLIGRR
ncbi:MAG TPA: hypothetical protein VF936_02660, partial [Burkholderiales bacterium]